MDQDSRESAATTIIHRKTQRNEKGKIQKIWRKVKVKNHVAEVLEAAKAG